MSTDPTPTVMRGSCACGANTFELRVVPTQRFYCHCLYCQEFMGKPYTDVTMVRAANVTVHAEHATSKRPRLRPPGFAHGRGSRFGAPRPGALREVRQSRSRPLQRLRSALRRIDRIGPHQDLLHPQRQLRPTRPAAARAAPHLLPVARSRRHRQTSEAPLLHEQPIRGHGDGRPDDPARLEAPSGPGETLAPALLYEDRHPSVGLSAFDGSIGTWMATVARPRR